ncbi:MAG TPA: acyl carrier protein [Burkholderiales bacterium]|jgi:acyl carrier protein
MNATSPDHFRAVFFEVLGAIAPETDPATIDPARPLREQVDLDSMDWLNVIIRLHERLGVDIPEQDYGELATLNGVVAYLARRAAPGAADVR